MGEILIAPFYVLAFCLPFGVGHHVWQSMIDKGKGSRLAVTFALAATVLGFFILYLIYKFTGFPVWMGWLA